jgi:hypothetical protein
MSTAKFNLTLSLIAAGLTLAGGTTRAAETEAATPPAAAKPAARPTTLPPAATKKNVTFAQDIKPLFETSCVRCHGGEKPKGHLRLETLAGVLAGSEDGKVVVPGDSAKSKIVMAVARLNPKTAMPPEPRQDRGGRPGQGGPGAPPNAPGSGTNSAPNAAPTADGAPAHPPGGFGGQGQHRQGPPPKPLTAEEVGLVRAWIDQGAK